MSLSRKPPQKSIFEHILAHGMPFLVVFFIIFLLTYGMLFAIDFIPEAPKQEVASVKVVRQVQAQAQTQAPTPPVVVDPYPQRMIIDTLNKDIKILNPESRTIADLDKALLSGAVRYPDSATFAKKGTIFLFGHSSYLPTVFNKNFQAFNGIQKLVWGDIIRVQSSDTEYRYRVSKIYKTKAGDASVTLEQGSAKLTLVTCNSFGSKDERFVVEADLTDTVAL